jgi:cobyrinic acid a,c-diamide synthase
LRGETLPIGVAGSRFRGHEFHYARVLSEAGTEPLFDASDARGRELGSAGQRVGRVFGSFVHLIDRAA